MEAWPPGGEAAPPSLPARLPPCPAAAAAPHPAAVLPGHAERLAPAAADATARLLLPTLPGDLQPWPRWRCVFSRSSSPGRVKPGPATPRTAPDGRKLQSPGRSRPSAREETKLSPGDCFLRPHSTRHGQLVWNANLRPFHTCCENAPSSPAARFKLATIRFVSVFLEGSSQNAHHCGSDQ